MAPLLIDQRSLIKSGFVLCLLFAIVFIGGYYSGYTRGYDRAESLSQQHESAPVALALPEPEHAGIGEFEPQPPAVVEPGADIDVDRPDTAVMEPVTSAAADTGAVTAGGGMRTDPPGAPVQLASLEITPDIVADTAQATKSRTGEAAASAPPASTGVSEARYTIQVGMYGNAGNAEQLLETLNAHRLDAYIDEFSNAKDETRFNVRFGFYRDRASAKSALQAYRSQLSGEGYVVRVSD